MRLRLALAAALVLAACSSAKPTPKPSAALPPNASTADAGSLPVDPTPAVPEGSLASKESKTVAKTLVRVSELRGIKSTKPVPGVKLDRDKLVGRIKDKALREYPADALRREGELLQIFGFAPASFNYLDEMMKLLDAQLEGFYEPKNGTMYLAADLKGKEAQATLAHELVHALQDQSWDLKSRSTYKPGKGDETMALACLAEGDATSLMMDYILADQGRTALDLPEPMMRELMASGMSGSTIEHVPHILKTTLIAPYIDGLAFVHQLRKKGGWPMVDRAWEKPPVTTEQVLHLDKWESHEPAIAVPAPSAQVLGEGWTRDDEDTFGELGFALTFEEWLEPAEARKAAAGWGGDRSAVWVKGEETAFVDHARFDPGSPKADAYAERALAKLAPGLKKNLGKAAIESSDVLCFERPQLGPLLFARRDRDLVIVTGPARLSKERVWTSTSTCARAKKWADEVFAQK